MRNLVHSGLSIVVGTVALATHALGAPQSWSHQFGTSDEEQTSSLASDGAGGVYVGGFTSGSLYGPHIGWEDFVLAHRAADGSTLWALQYGDGGRDFCTDLASDGIGGVFVTRIQPFNKMGWLERFSATGTLYWQQAFSAPLGADTRANAVAADGAGGCFVAGYTTGELWGPATGPGDQDAWVIHYSASGNLQWFQKLAVVGSNWAIDLASDGAGGVFVGGSGPAVGVDTEWVARFDGTGQLLWQEGIGGATGQLWGIAADGAGGVVVAARVEEAVGGPHGGLTDIYLERIDGSGTTLWSRQLGGPGADEPHAVAVDGSGRIALAGMTWGAGFGPGTLVGPTFGDNDVWIARYDLAGNLEYLHALGTSALDEAQCVAVDDQGIFVGGFSTGALLGTHLGGGDAFVLRMDDCELQGLSTYCVGAINSTGEGATIGHLGSRVLGNNDFVLAAGRCPPGQVGIFILGPGQASTPFGNGVLCVGGGVLRLLPPQPTGTTGNVALSVDFTDAGSPASQITAGSTWNFQFWYRDIPGGGAGFNLSNGLSVSFCP